MAASKLEKYLKLKTWGIFVVSLAITLSLCTWSYRSFQSVVISLNHLGRPNAKLMLINETVQEMNEAENHVNSYILTNDTVSRSIYRLSIKSVRENIDKLKELFSGDLAQTERIDSLQNLFEKKLEYQRAFLRAKRKRLSSEFVSEALGIIMHQTSDTALVEK